MEKLDRKELILKGDMYRVIAVLSVPIMVNNLIQTLYNLADALWVTRLGAVQFAATSFVWPVLFLFISLGIGVSVAGTSILSQLIGADEYEDANEYASQLIVISLILSVFFAILGYFSSSYIVKLMGGTGDLAAYSDTYLKISFLGFPFVFLYFNFNSIMSAQGNTLAPTILSGVSALINVVLDPIFIFTLDMGVAGAAVATVVSQAVLLFAGIYMIKKKSPNIQPSFKNFRFNKKKLDKVINVGLPASIGQSGAALGFVVLNSFIVSYGDITLAAFGMVNRITSLIMQPPMGIGVALTSIVGQNMGAGQMDRVDESFKKSVQIVMVVSVLGLALLLWKDTQVIAAFMGSDSEKEVIEQGITYLRYISVTMPFMGLFSVFQGLFQGSGHTKYSMAMAIGRLWIIRIPMILLFKYFTDLGPVGIWFSMSASNVLICIYGYVIYKKNRWKKQVISREERHA